MSAEELHYSRAGALRLTPFDPLYNGRTVPQTRITDPPYHCLHINKKWVPIVDALFERLLWEDAYTGEPETVANAIDSVGHWLANLWLGDIPCGRQTKGGVHLPDGVQWNGDDIEIRMCDLMGNIYIYNCCGDGDGTGGAGGFDGSGSGSGAGSEAGNNPLFGTYDDNRVSACDASAWAANYLLTQARELLQNIDTLLDQGANTADAISEALEGIPGLEYPGAWLNSMVEYITGIRDIAYQDAINALLDSDLLLRAQTAMLKVLGGDTEYVDRITRQNLLAWSRKLPWFWGTALDGVLFSPVVFFEIFSRFINLERMNNKLILAEGFASDGLCSYLYQEARLPQPTISSPTGVEPPPPSYSVVEGGTTYTLYLLATGGEVYSTNGTPPTTQGFSNVVGVGYNSTADMADYANASQRLYISPVTGDDESPLGELRVSTGAINSTQPYTPGAYMWTRNTQDKNAWDLLLVQAGLTPYASSSGSTATDFPDAPATVTIEDGATWLFDDNPGSAFPFDYLLVLTAE